MFALFKNRDAVKKYLLIFFLGIVSLSMVVVMAPFPGGDSSRPEGNALASISGRSITGAELDQTIRDRFKNSPMGFDRKMMPMVAPTVLNQMITEEILIQQAGKMGIQVSDQEILKALQHIPWLYPDGNFVGSDKAADLVAQQTGMTWAQFEAIIRKQMLEEKMRNIVTDGVQVTPAEVRAQFRQRNNKAKIDYVVFDPSQFIKDVKVAPEDLAAYFQKNPARYKLPEQRQVRYVLIDSDQVKSEVHIDDNELRQYYTAHLGDYRVPDRVRVAHILLKTTGKSPAEVAAVEKTAADVLNQVRAGGNFGELAKKFSEDSTAQAGGELGWITKGQTVPEFESTAFSLKPGETSGLVKTIYGIHIIKSEEKQVAHQQLLDEVRNSIAVEIEKQRVASAQADLANKLIAGVKANPQQFDDVVRKLGLEPKLSPLFKYNQAIPDLGKTDAFENLAYQLRVNEVGTPVSVPRGEAIIQLAQIVPEHIPALDEVQAAVEEDFRHDQSIKLAQEKAQKLAELAKTQDFDKAAKSLGLTSKESNDFAANEYIEGIGSATQLSDAFTLNPGQVSNVITAGTNPVLFKVVSHTPANDADFAAQSDQLTEELLDQKRDLQFEIYRDNLKQEFTRAGKLKMNADGMKQFLASYQAE